jgi:hypothetical protein
MIKTMIGRIFEDSSASFLARIRKANGGLIQQSDINSILVKVFNTHASSVTPVYSDTLVISSVIFNTLQTGEQWGLDATGYNFIHTVPATAFATPSKNHRVEYKISLTDGGIIWLTADVVVQPVLSS